MFGRRKLKARIIELEAEVALLNERLMKAQQLGYEWTQAITEAQKQLIKIVPPATAHTTNFTTNP